MHYFFCILNLLSAYFQDFADNGIREILAPLLKWVRVDTGFEPGATCEKHERSLCAMRPPPSGIKCSLEICGQWYNAGSI